MSAPDAIAGLMEMRGLGIIAMPHAKFAVVAMALVSIAETTYMGALGTAPFHTKAIWTRLSTGLCTGLCTD